MKPKITQLNIYPLKSARPIRLKTMKIINSGPEYDREWMLTKPNGQFLSQRTHAILGQIQPEITTSSLLLNAPGMECLELPLEYENFGEVTVQIFGKEAPAQKLSSMAHEWASDYLKQSVLLVRSSSAGSRQTSGKRGPITPLHFADGYPFLLTNEASLNQLNEKLPHAISMDRFRPNIVIDTHTPSEEDEWSQFNIGKIPFLAVKACTRCKIIDLDPATGDFNNQVSKTLKNYRTLDGKIVFGQNLIHQSTGTISLDDRIESIEFKS